MNTKRWALVAASLGMFYVLVRHRHSIYGSIRRKALLWHPLSLQNKRIEVINSIHESERVLIELKK